MLEDKCFPRLFPKTLIVLRVPVASGSIGKADAMALFCASLVATNPVQLPAAQHRHATDGPTGAILRVRSSYTPFPFYRVAPW